MYEVHFGVTEANVMILYIDIFAEKMETKLAIWAEQTIIITLMLFYVEIFCRRKL
jgi:hypothetical protein